jgi:redox-sensing transcriptional repressor
MQTGVKIASLSVPAKKRLLQLMRLLEKRCQTGAPLSSAQAEHLTGWPRDTIRKDISCLHLALGLEDGGSAAGAIGGSAGYDAETLIPLIKKALGLDRRRKFCIVGLGRRGSAYLNFTPPELAEFELAAGFDSNVNRVEILAAAARNANAAPLYPAYKMAEVISRFGIEIALLCVPALAAQQAAEKCAAAGIRGILNFAPAAINLPPEIAVRNVYVADELRALAIKMKSD